MNLFSHVFSAVSVVTLHQWLARRRLATLTVVALILLCALWLGSKATLDTSSLTFFPDSDPEMARMAQAMDMAPFSRLLLVDVAAKESGQEQRLAEVAKAVALALPPDLARQAGTGAGTGAKLGDDSHADNDASTLPDPKLLLRLVPSLVNAEGLALLQASTTPAAIEQAVQQGRTTLAGLWGSMAAPWIRHDPLNFRRILLQRLPQPPGVGMADPVLGFPLSADGKHVLLALRPARSLHDVDAAVALMNALRAALKEHVPPDMQATVVGAHRHSAANTQSINNDIQRIVLWSMAGFALVYLLFVRSFSGAFWLLLTPLAAASATLGTLSLCWPVISGLALGFGASVLGIAEDYAVHMHFALRNARAQNYSTSTVLSLLSLPLFQGFLLNISGFAVLLFSSIPALRQLAAFALLTLTVGLVLALVVLPLCPGFDRPAITPPKRRAVKAQPRVWPVSLCAALLLCLCALLWPHIDADVSPRGMGADVEAMQRDAEYLRTVWGSRTEHLWVVQGQNQQDTLQTTRLVVEHLRAKGQAVDTLTDLWPAPEVLAENLRRWEAFVAAHPHLPAQLQEAGRQAGFAKDAFAPLIAWLKETPRPVDAALLREAGLHELANTFLEVTVASHRKGEQGGARSLILARGDVSVDPNGAAPPRLTDMLSDLPPQLREHVTALSPLALEEALLGHLQHERRLLPIAAVLCFALLFACFRRVPPTLLAALPALAALTAILAWLGFTSTPLTLAGMATLPLVLGLALDHGVVVTHDLALGTHLGVDRAIVTSSLTALTGMGLLALAEHPALRSMGQIIFPGLVMEMLVALWVLPRLCKPERIASTQRATP